MAKNVIFTNSSFGYKEEDYQNYLEEMDMNESEYSFEEWINDEISNWLNAEEVNLDIPCGEILCIASLGLWNGTHQGYKILRGGNVKHIFSATCGDLVEFYTDRYNVRCSDTHHDGTNTYLFREIREGVDIDKLCQKIYDGEEIDCKTLNRYTKSLRPYVAKVYGW